MARVLGIGIATLDWVQVLEQYPPIDSEIRAQQQFLWRGGNATNSLVVLSQLGEQCSWLGTLADDVFAELICADLDRNQVDYSHCPRIQHAVSPASHILLCSESDSRNIVHYRDLRELEIDECISLDFSAWDWIHIEGRNVQTTLTLMSHLQQKYPDVIVSLEIEKPRQGIEQLYDYADHLLFGRQYVSSQGFSSVRPFLEQLQASLTSPKDIVCAWGEQGAMALSIENEYFEVPALDVTVVDTRGAGDVFNAAYIHARINGEGLQQSVEQACLLAGKKCAQQGLDKLV